MMSESRLQIRRGRRTDFTAVMRLLADPEGGAAIPDRRTLRRFRAIVDDLGGDFYIGLIDGEIAGLVHVTYARQLTLTPRASIDQLLVDPRFRRRRVGVALLDFARERAIRRGCGTLDCSVPPRNVQAAGFLEKAGMRRSGQLFAADLCDLQEKNHRE